MIISNLTLLIVFSMLYVVGLSYLYFSKTRLDNGENKIYKVLLILNLVGLFLQLACDFISYKYDFIPIIVSSIVFRLYLVYFIAWVSLVILYLIEVSFKHKKIANIITIIVATILSVILLILPYELKRDVVNRIYYTYGDAVQFTFIASEFLSVCIFIILVIKNKKITKKKAMPIYLFLAFGMLTMVIQMMKPELVITTTMESLICCLMYFTIENPDLKVIEQLKVANDFAEKANRAKSDFLSSMSHEIRTPLNAIVGFSECIKTEETLEDAKKDADDIIMASGNLLEIVNGILDISKIEANKMEIVNTDYNLLPNLENLAKLMIPRIGEKPIELNTKFAQDIPSVMYGDIGKIKQIITNLLTNAVKYTEQGHINFNVNCINDSEFCSLVISVSDTGRGIKPDKISKLFTKFNRLEEDRNTTLEGTGLGLAITKSLIEMMGGKIVVQSTYGEGSIFTVYLKQKIIQLHGGANLTNIIEEQDNYDFSSHRVLIVDDNKLNLKVADKILKRYKISTKLVESGSECIDLIKNNEKFDLILMDDMMPKMRGSEALNILKQIVGFDTPTIALTANALSGMKEAYLRLGFTDYLAKPIEKTNLIAILNKYLNRKEKIVNDNDIINNQVKKIESTIETPINDPKNNINDFNYSGSKVLIVDDNKVNIKIATNFLKPFNFDIDEALSGFECLKKVKNTTYDIIFMDDMMPEMSGVETLHKLKENSEFATKIIALTANAVDGAKEKYLKEGFDAYIAKPINKQILEKTINSLLSREIKKGSQVLVNLDEKNEKEDLIDVTKELLDMSKPLKEIHIDTNTANKEYTINHQFSPVNITEEASNIMNNNTKGNVEFLKTNGIDVNHGLELLGDMEMYNETLNDFINAINERIDKLKSYKENDMKNYAIEVHALKSDCKYLGIMKLADLAYQHELQSKDNNINFVHDNFDDLMDEINKNIKIIKSYI